MTDSTDLEILCSIANGLNTTYYVLHIQLTLLIQVLTFKVCRGSFFDYLQKRPA